MILFEIRDYMKQRMTASLDELSVVFKKQEDELQPLLDRWVRKGVIECVSLSGCAKGACQTCPMPCSTYYRFVPTLGRQQIPVRSV